MRDAIYGPALGTLVLLLGFGTAAVAADADKSAADVPKNLPQTKAVSFKEITAQPAELLLRGADAMQQLILTGVAANGRPYDVTAKVKYRVSDPKVVRVTATGLVIPLADGKAEIVASLGGKEARVAVQVTDYGVNLPINFPNQIVPIFTKLGCNAGACHGKASGQNGFKLSLLGFEPDIDYMALVKEARGRRTFPAAPERSLLLLKAIGEVPHGGGKKMEKDSPEYRLVRRWIALGMPYGSPDDPFVTRISVFPEHRILDRESQQQVAVYAHYSDGSVEDVTLRAKYESNDTDIATVSETGQVQTLTASGEAAIMVRYQGQVATFRATVPLGLDIPEYEFPYQTLVDRYTHAKFQELGLVPSDLCTDEEFIRRASLDICGTLPTPEEVRRFVADQDPDKRNKLVDALLERPEYAYYFAGKWADILHVRRSRQQNRAIGTFAFHEWLRTAMAEDLPYDEFIRQIIAATGNENTHPPTVWYKEVDSYQEYVDDTAQVFLGLRLACAQCHHHPFEKWSQDDYWGIAAFFSRVGRKQYDAPGGFGNQRNQQLQVFVRSSGSVTNKRTGRPAQIKPLDGEPLDIPRGQDPRLKLVEWMTRPDNPFVARALVNRYWAHFFGRGIVDPLDDMRVTNPPSNAALLEALAKDFVEHGYSLKHVIRTIAKSRTYQLSAVPNKYNRFDKQNFARFYPRRLSAEVLLDAIGQVTASPVSFRNLPQDSYAPKRAIMLPDETYTNYFLEVFGKPARTSACECERVSEANLAQALHLLNSQEIQNMLSRGGGRADQLAKDKTRDDRQKIEELFLWCFARKPTEHDYQVALSHIAKLGDKNKKTAYENILWALVNTKEFLFND